MKVKWSSFQFYFEVKIGNILICIMNQMLNLNYDDHLCGQ